ncbi:VWA-like domain-containing protein [Clostridium oryzae]|uniref:VWA-like domain-containing protein n=1 Tax=Clostridium oryzae TaxID=1450648 RepID=A0A1V4ISJ7_9CLOT|nr:VWA-like domain-containing protein [Clostridium oryzae]OPJ62437.1 hypothetical protein CLORY_18060 [Clostridium oryzae]
MVANSEQLDTIKKEVYAFIVLSEPDEEVFSKNSYIREKFDNFLEHCILRMLNSENVFFANFIIALRRQVDFNINEPIATVPENNHFTMYINPKLLLECSISEIEALIKHEVYHIISMHHQRSVNLKKIYSTIAVNLAMDISINQFISNLPVWSYTIESVNKSFNLDLEEDKPLEYYAEKIDKTLKEKFKISENSDISIDIGFIQNLHRTWTSAGMELDSKAVENSIKTLVKANKDLAAPESVKLLINTIENRSVINWLEYLKKYLGGNISYKKKTVTRRNRRQLERLDLRGTLSSNKADVIVAMDTSGSMTELEIKNILSEILNMISTFHFTLRVIECDSSIRNVYYIRSKSDIKTMPKNSGSTKFLPVFKYIHDNKIKDSILIYFTDGFGEDYIPPSLYPKKLIWVLTSADSKLSVKNNKAAVLKLKTYKKEDEDILPLEYLNNEMKDVRSEWAK